MTEVSSAVTVTVRVFAPTLRSRIGRVLRVGVVIVRDGYDGAAVGRGRRQRDGVNPVGDCSRVGEGVVIEGRTQANALTVGRAHQVKAAQRRVGGGEGVQAVDLHPDDVGCVFLPWVVLPFLQYLVFPMLQPGAPPSSSAFEVVRWMFPGVPPSELARNTW